MGLIKYLCTHNSGHHEPIPVKFCVWVFSIMFYWNMVMKMLKWPKIWWHHYSTTTSKHPKKKNTKLIKKNKKWEKKIVWDDGEKGWEKLGTEWIAFQMVEGDTQGMCPSPPPHYATDKA